jgi:RHS repeat-associated protein
MLRHLFEISQKTFNGELMRAKTGLLIIVKKLVLPLLAFAFFFCSAALLAAPTYVNPSTGEIASSPISHTISDSNYFSIFNLPSPTTQWKSTVLYITANFNEEGSIYVSLGNSELTERIPVNRRSSHIDLELDEKSSDLTRVLELDNTDAESGKFWLSIIVTGSTNSLTIEKIELIQQPASIELTGLNINSHRVLTSSGFSPGLRFDATTSLPADVSFVVYDNEWNTVYETIISTRQNAYGLSTPAAGGAIRSSFSGSSDDEPVNRASGYWDLRNAFLPLPGYYKLVASVDGGSLYADFEVQSTEADQVGNFSPGTEGGFDIFDNFDPAIPNESSIAQDTLPITPHVGDPVNLVSGNLYTTETDMVLKSRLPLTLQRSYNSVDPQVYLFGRGWLSPYSSHLEINDSAIIFVQPDGGRKLFTITDGIIDNPIGSNLKLSIHGDGWQIVNPGGALWIFNSSGSLIAMTRPGLADSSENSIILSYDDNGLLKTVTNPSGQFFSFSYNESNLVSSVSDSTGRSTSYQYDENLNLISFINAIGQGTTYQYDSQNMLSAIIQPGNYLTEITYDKGRVVTMNQANGVNINFEWEPDNYLVNCSDSAGVARAYQFNENWKLTSYTVKAPDKEPVIRTYIASGAMTVGYIDANGNKSEYSYDQKGNLVEIKDPLGNSTVFDIDANTSQRTKISDATGRNWQYSWNNLGKLDSFISPANGKTTFSYDENGMCVSETDPLGRVTSYRYSDDKSFLTEIINPASISTRLSYDKRGNLVILTDALGRETVFNYDPLDRLIKTVYSDGSFVEVEYDAAGNLITRRDNIGRITRFAYDSYCRLIAVTFPDNTTQTYTLDTMGRRIAQTDQLGRITVFEYDQRFEGVKTAKLTKVVFPDGSCECYEYDSEGNLKVKQDAAGNRYTYDYDAANRLVSTTDPTGGKWENTIDAVGRVASIKDPLGRVTAYLYNGFDQIAELIRPDGLSVRWNYDAIGNLISIEDALGNIRAFEYDNSYRVIREIQPGGASSTFTYDLAGQKISETDPLGRIIRFSYDNGGRIKSITDPENHVWRFEYDAASRLQSRIDPLGATYTNIFDSMDRQISTVNPLGHSTAFEYDPTGRLTAVVDALNRRLEMTYDNRGRLVSETDHEGRKTLYTHDGCGNLASRTDAEGKTWRWQYDGVSRIKTTIDPLGNTINYSWDLSGNLACKTNGRGQATVYNYDLLDRLVKIEYPDKKPVSLSYDASGREISREDESGRIIKTWNALGRLISEKFSIKGCIEPARGWSYDYDAAGNRIRACSPAGKSFTYKYDARNNLAKLNLPDWHGSISYVYDAAGRLTGSSRPGIRQTNTYNLIGQLTDISYAKASGKTNKILASRHYMFDPVGNPLQIKDENGAITSLSYNGANWLTRVVYPDGLAVAYDYDQTGNRISEKAGSSPAVIYGYDAAGRMIARGTDTFLYDQDGNLVDSEENGKNTRYHWTSDNRLLRVESPARCARHNRSNCSRCPTKYETVESYSYYPGDWRRSIRQTPAATFVSMYDGDDESHEYLVLPDLSSKKSAFGFIFNHFKLPRTVLQREFMSGPYSDDIEITGYMCRPLQHLKDGIGSTIALADRSGGVVARMNYDVWGNFRWPAKKDHLLPPCKEDDLGDLLDRLGSVFTLGSAHDPWHCGRHFAAALTPYLYTGRRYQPSTGLYFNRNRYYKPQPGRFISSDPLGFAGGNNLWAYADNSPAANTDPYGLIAVGDEVDLYWDGSGWDVTDSIMNELREGFYRDNPQARMAAFTKNISDIPISSDPESSFAALSAAAIGIPKILTGLGVAAETVVPAITAVAPYVPPALVVVTVGVTAYATYQAWQNYNTIIGGVQATRPSFRTNPIEMATSNNSGSGTGQSGKIKIDPNKPAGDVLPGSLRPEFPGEHLGKSLNQIKDLLKTATGKAWASLSKAKKMLEQADRLVNKVRNR